MAYMYYIDISAGVFVRVSAHKTRNGDFLANPTRYFRSCGTEKPKPVNVTGWPFEKMYITEGDIENGFAVAWPAK